MKTHLEPVYDAATRTMTVDLLDTEYPDTIIVLTVTDSVPANEKTKTPAHYGVAMNKKVNGTLTKFGCYGIRTEEYHKKQGWSMRYNSHNLSAICSSIVTAILTGDPETDAMKLYNSIIVDDEGEDDFDDEDSLELYLDTEHNDGESFD